METVQTGLGGEVGIKTAAVLVTLVSSVLLFGVLLALGQSPVLSLVEVVTMGLVSGAAYYGGLRQRS
jgi:hydrogenase/urease accessory protein HupE